MKILVVEDDPVIAQTLQLLLSSCHYTVDIAADGEVGLEMVEAFSYDLLLLDMVLPKVDGISLCQQVRDQGHQMPILLLTGQAAETQKVLALNAGADDYVVKPFDTQELIARIQALLRRGKSSRQSILHWGSLSLNPNSRQAFYGISELGLTPKEYAILELLLHHPQTVFSAQAILDHGWPATESPGEETIRTHVKELRRKLTTAGAPRDLIKTIYRVGYQLNSVYSAFSRIPGESSLTPVQIAELQSVNEQSRIALEKLQSTQTQLSQSNRELQIARAELEQQVDQRTKELMSANQSLRQQQEQWQALFDHALEAIAITNDEGRYLEVNPAACTLFGLPRKALLGRAVTDFADPVVDIVEVWQQFLQQGQMSGEFRLHRLDGTVRDTEFNALANFVPGQHLSILRDVTARKHREADAAFLADINEICSSLFSTEDLIQALGAKMGAYLNVAACNFCEIDEAKDLIIYFGCWQASGEPCLPARLCLSAQVSEEFCRRARAGETIVSHNTQTNPVTLAEANAAIGALSFITVPFHNNGDWKYLFSVHDSRPRVWREDEIKLVQELANYFFPRLDRARAEEVIAENLRDTQRLHEMSTKLTTENNIQVLYDEIVATAVTLMHADRGTLQILDPFNNELQLQASHRIHPVAIDFWKTVKVNTGSVCSVALESGRREIIVDVENSDAVNTVNLYHYRLCSIRAVQSTPLISRSGQLLGMFSTHWCQPHQPSKRELQSLDLLARQAADLIEHHQASQALRASEQRLNLFVRNAPVNVAMFDRNMCYLAVSQRWIDTYQLGSIEAVLGRCHYDLLPTPEHWQQVHQRGLMGLSETNNEDLWCLSDGSQQWVQWEVQPWWTTTREVGGIIIFIVDITHRKQAEKALQENQQQLQSVLDNAPAVVYVIDLQDKHLLCNRSYASLLGLTPDQIVGQGLTDVWPSEMINTFKAQNRQVLETKQLLQIEEAVSHLDGTQHTYLTTKFPLYDSTGQAYAICGISTDITDKKQLETQVYQAQRLESLGTLTSGIAHDLNNVLTPILGITQMLRLKTLNLEAQQETLSILEDSARRAVDLVKQVLTFTRGSTETCDPVDITLVVAETVSLIQRTFPKSITVRQLLPEQQPAVVLANTTQLHQVLMNLCINARDAMPNGGNLSLSVENFKVNQRFASLHLQAKVGPYILITVTDTGSGIAPEVVERIFEPFFTTKPLGRGTGLGLSTALGIIRSFGGFVEVESQVGRGSQFKIYLPALKKTGPLIAHEDTLPQGQGELILVVDDEEDILTIVQAILESSHYRVLTARCGEAAIACYAEQQQDIQVVLLDMMMPDIDGLTTLHALQEINPQVKVIAITGLPALYRQSLAKLGVKTLLAKPFTTAELLKSLVEITGKSRDFGPGISNNIN